MEHSGALRTRPGQWPVYETRAPASPELLDGLELTPLEPARLAEHRPRSLRAAVAMSGSREDAEDLVQETFEQVLRRPRFVQRGRDAART